MKLCNLQSRKRQSRRKRRLESSRKIVEATRRNLFPSGQLEASRSGQARQMDRALILPWQSIQTTALGMDMSAMERAYRSSKRQKPASRMRVLRRMRVLILQRPSRQPPNNQQLQLHLFRLPALPWPTCRCKIVQMRYHSHHCLRRRRRRQGSVLNLPVHPKLLRLHLSSSHHATFRRNICPCTT